MPKKKKAAPKKKKGTTKATGRVRDYRKEYDDFHGKPEEIKRRNARGKARKKMVKAGRVKKGDGKDVDHKDRNPKNNSSKNLRVQSRKTNRARNSHRKKK